MYILERHCLMLIAIPEYARILYAIYALNISMIIVFIQRENVSFKLYYSLQMLPEINTKMNKKFLKFIAQCQVG